MTEESESFRRHKASADHLNLGHLAYGQTENDAVHIAATPLIAVEILRPGQHIGLDDDGKPTTQGETIGIVDPFLVRPVLPGQPFWLCLYPGTITSLRHHWTHPKFK